MTLRDIVSAGTLSVALVALFGSFLVVKFGDPPEQHVSPITGFPTWHQPYKNESKEVTLSFILLALLFTTGASLAARQATRSPSRSLTGIVNLKTGNEESSTQMNEFIQYYIDSTWIAIFGYMFFDVGKIWAVVGALHNLLEVALLITLHQGGRVSSFSFGLYLFGYVCAVILLSVYLPWPFDAIFFRWQGLCSDFGLIVMFVRIYTATKKQLKAFGDINRHDQELAKAQRAADTLALEQEQQIRSSTMLSTTSLQSVNLQGNGGSSSSNGNGASTENVNGGGGKTHALRSGWKKFVALAPTPEEQSNNSSDHHHGTSSGSQQEARFAGERVHVIDFVTTSTPTNGQAPATSSKVSVVALNQDESIWGVHWCNPDQLILLIAGAVFHVVGNCLTTIWVSSQYAMAAFHISYGLSFPMYAYYLYVDNHALRQTKIYLPEFSKIKIFIATVLSFIGATLTVRLGLYVASHESKDGLF